MTTEKATLILAHWLTTGTIDISRERISQQFWQVYELMPAAVAQGQCWNWSAAEKHLHAAYQVLGAEPVGTGYDWHKGSHPIQIAAQSMEDARKRTRAANQIS